MNNKVQGELNPNYKHGGKGTRLYNIWKDIKRRCDNPKSSVYKYYGGKGIKRCSEWDDFTVFRSWSLCNGYNDILSIDRKDNSKGYSPENCRWVDVITQRSNTSKNVYLEIDGEKVTASAAGRIVGIEGTIIANRLKSGWSQKEALETPPKYKNHGRLR